MGNSNNEALRTELIRMSGEDQRVREELLRSDQLPRNRYSEHMAKVHRRNNTRLRELIEKYGWPGKSLVEEDGGTVVKPPGSSPSTLYSTLTCNVIV